MPSFTTDIYEKKNQNTPSHGIFPEFDSRSMTYKDLQKCEDVGKLPNKKFIDLYGPHLACEVQIEECSCVPLPKKDDFDWGKISHREVRAVLFDFRTCEFVSNSFIVGAQWKQDYESKWLFNTSESLNHARNFILRTDIMR